MGDSQQVAIITRTKDRAILLERAFRSVLDQTFGDWSLIVVNDGGDQAPVERLVEKYRDEFRGRITVIHQAVSTGMEAASNRGIAACDSKYVVIHDDDDSWAPGFLQTCIDELEETAQALPSVKGVITYAVQVMEHVEADTVVVDSVEPFNEWVGHGLLNYYRMIQGNMFPPISFLYLREAYNQIGPYRSDLPVLGDWEYNLRFMSQFDICIVPTALAFYHHRPGLSTVLGNSVIAGRDTHLLYDQLLRNQLLRADLQGTGRGEGILMNLARDMLNLSDKLSTYGGIAIGNASQKPSLMRKFAKHWRERGPIWALTVTLRYMFPGRSRNAKQQGQVQHGK